MSHPVHQELPKPSRAINRRLAFGVFAPPAAWFAHEVIGVAVVGRNCGGGLAAWQWAVLVTVSLITAAVTVAAAVTSYRVFRAWTGGGSPTSAEGWNRVEFVSLLGIFVSSLLLLNIIYFGVMPFVVQACVRTI